MKRGAPPESIFSREADQSLRENTDARDAPRRCMPTRAPRRTCRSLSKLVVSLEQQSASVVRVLVLLGTGGSPFGSAATFAG